MVSRTLATVARSTAAFAGLCLSGLVLAGTLTITPSPKDFGPVSITAAPAGDFFQVTNAGTNTQITTVSIIGVDAAQFGLSLNSCNGTTLTSGASCNVIVTFDPTTVGVKLASFTVSTVSSGVFNSALQGTGIAASGTLTPSPLAFGDQTVGTTPSLPLTLQCAAAPFAESCTVGVITISGANASRFGQTNNCPASLIPGTSCQIDVTFAPIVTGPHTASLSVATNVLGGIPAVPLSGTGVGALNPPGAPTIGTATPGNAQATVTFTAPASDGGAPITSYTATSTPGGFTGSAANSPVTVTGLANGTSYTFTVHATTVAGNGAESAASNAVTPRTVPGAPTIGTATPGIAQATVTFTAPASDGGATIAGYTATSSPGGITGTAAASPVTVNGLTNGQAYTFTVVATNVAGNGAASAASNSVIPGAPGAPTIGTATPGNAQASITFSPPASSGASPITSYIATSNPGGLTGTSAGSPVTVTGLSNGLSYSFTVQAVNATGPGPSSAPSNVVAPRTTPSAPFIGTATAANGQASVPFTVPDFNGGAAITSYTATSSPGGITAVAGGSPILVFGLTNGTTYTFTVFATNAAGDGPASAPSNAVTPKTVPGSPTAVSAAGGNTQATVTFTPPASNGGATITSYTATSSPGGIFASGAGSPITVTGLANGTSYTFTVHATNSVGNSPASSASNAVIPGLNPPGAPTAVSAIAASGEVTVAFTPPAGGGATSYTVTCNPGGTVTGTTTPLTVTGLANGTAYSCTVVAANLSGSSPASAPSNSVTPSGLPVLLGVAQVAGGDRFTCVRTTAGGVKCWGENNLGQLGDGSTSTHRLMPGNVSGLASGVTAIAAGANHACAIVAGGGVKCWGANAASQLGDGSTNNRSTPVDISGLAGTLAISAGEQHTCALLAGGVVKCWGSNARGQLGDSTTTTRPTPIDVAGLGAGVSAIGAGRSHNCAVTSGGGVKCWGANDSGQMGDGTFATDRLAPVDASGLASGVAAVAGGEAHTCARMVAGGVKCWGNNDTLQIGDNTFVSRLTAVDVVGLGTGISVIAAGTYHTCAMTSGGGVKCWGSPSAGQVGNNSFLGSMVPVDVWGVSGGAVAIGTGARHSCAVTPAGGLRCWGDDEFGQLGDNTELRRLTPVDVSGLSGGMATVALGDGHACARTSGGAVKCWGDNFQGQLGDNTTTNRLVPVDTLGLPGAISKLAAYSHFTCALTAGGGVKCWGANSGGQLGDGSTTDRPVPADVSGLGSGVVAIAAGDGHACAITTGGGVKCWGGNDSGQVGDNTTTTRLTPVDVSGIASGATLIAAGQSHTCAVVSGGVKCWGRNSKGQLGDNTQVDSHTPVNVAGLASGVVAIGTGDEHSCALTTGGGVKCWGDNLRAQIGDGSVNTRLTPVDVVGLGSGMSAITSGTIHNCAIGSGGGLVCWGYNNTGALGDGTRVLRTAPVSVLGLSSGVSVATAGRASTCAVTTAGAVKCWGQNPYGIIGDGTAGLRAFPAPAVTAAVQVIVFNALPDRSASDPPFTLSATGGGSGNPVTFASLTTPVCTTGGLNGATVTLIGAGTCTIRASQAGNANYDAAPAVDRSFNVATANPPRLGNISTRMQVLTGNDVMIGGFVIGGSINKTVAIVATGPSLAAFGITNALANPSLTLVRSSDQQVIATNDDWQTAANQAQLVAAGFAPSNALEAAILVSLPPGAYTAIVSGVSNGTGVAVVGVYEVDALTTPLINISTRGRVLTGNDVMIGGFVIQGSGPQTVAIVATGPSLAQFGIASPLADPSIQLVRSSDQVVLATNDNWQEDVNNLQLQAAGFAPSNALESGLYRTLPPGAYTVIVQGVGGGTGVAVIGVYKVN